MKTMLEEIYAIIPLTATPLKFIPYSLKYDSPDMFRSVVRTQTEYIDTHRNIPLPGWLSSKCRKALRGMELNQPPSKFWHLAARMILASLIFLLRLPPTQKNISWIDAKLAAIFELTMITDKLEERDFPHHVEHLSSQFVTHNRTVPSFTYTVDSFPVLSTPDPLTNCTQPVTPNSIRTVTTAVETPSTSTRTSSMTDAEAKQFISECVQQEQSKLTVS
jgi:hypothetical protein